MKTRVTINGTSQLVETKKEAIPGAREENRKLGIKGIAFLVVTLITLAIGTSAFSGPSSVSSDSEIDLIQDTDTGTDKDATDKDSTDKDTEVPDSTDTDDSSDYDPEEVPSEE